MVGRGMAAVGLLVCDMDDDEDMVCVCVCLCGKRDAQGMDPSKAVPALLDDQN